MHEGSEDLARDPRGRSGLSSLRAESSGNSAREDLTGGSPIAGTESRPVRISTAVLVLVAIALGTAIRLWLMFHQPINADEAVDGLMARQILLGHFSSFYWGQVYGGVEPYVTAGLFVVFGQETWVIRLGPELLSAVAALLTWRLALRLVRDRGLALMAGAFFWCFSEAAIWNSTYEWGFRGVTMASGLGALLFAFRIFDGHRTLGDAAVLGTCVGIGWWSSPEIAYFLFPVGILLIASGWRSWHRRLRSWIAPACVATLCALISALPWIWVNVRTNLASLRIGTFHTGPHVTHAGNLGIFFHRAFFIELGLQYPYTGAWIVGNGHSVVSQLTLVLLLVVVISVIAVSLVISLVRDAKSRVIAVACLGFPILYAASPATGYWGDGRYVVYLGPFLVLLFAVTSEELPHLITGSRRRTWGRRLPRRAQRGLGVILVVALGLVLIDFHQAGARTPSSFFRAWTDPDGPAQQDVDALISHGITRGYANYWIAYKLDFMGGGTVQLATAGDDVDRSQAMDFAVAHARHPAWLFVQPARMAAVAAQFNSALGPGGASEASFRQWLTSEHIGYRILDVGPLVAVIPDQHITVVHTGLRFYG
jgi:4-amino-4-deoxy-L-arabinose transferase-like glycosyltransferase